MATLHINLLLEQQTLLKYTLPLLKSSTKTFKSCCPKQPTVSNAESGELQAFLHHSTYLGTVIRCKDDDVADVF